MNFQTKNSLLKLQNSFEVYGNIGVSNDLDISGGIYAQGTKGSNDQVLTTNGSIVEWKNITDLSGNGLVDISDISASGTYYPTFVDGSGNNRQMFINSFNTLVYKDQKIGIGRSSPVSTLDVSGTANITGNLSVDTNTLFVDASNNRVCVGTINPNLSSRLTVNSNDSIAAISINRYNKDGPAYLYFTATDGSEGNPTSVTGNRTIGNINFAAYDGTKFIGSVATIAANVDSGSVGSTNMPGNLRFYTRAINDVSDTNAALNSFERMRILSNGNVGIGTTTPSSTLDVSGTANVTGNLSVDTNTLFVDASNNRVGIGKTNPQTTLDVSGNLLVSRGVLGQNAPLFVDVSNNRVGIAMRAQNPQAPLHVQSDNNNSTQVIISGGGSHAYTNRGLRIATHQVSSGDDGVTFDAQFQSGEFLFQTAGVNRMRITNGGNVGIGTTTPNATLDVSGTANITGNLSVDTNTLFVNASNNRVGIGLTTPANTLDVRGITRITNDDGNSMLYVNSVNPTGISATILNALVNSGGGYGELQTRGSIQTFYTPTQDVSAIPTERMRISGAGNVGIGTTTPNYKLQVEGSGTANEIVGWFNNQGAFSSSIAVRQASKTAFLTNHNGLGTPNYDGQLSNAISLGVSSGASPIQFWNGNTGVGARGTAKMTILENGNVGIGTTTPATQLQLSLDSASKPTTNTWTISSDKRVKENIEDADIEICYNVAKNLKLRRFRWNEKYIKNTEDHNMVGYIAQEVEHYLPKAITTVSQKFLIHKAGDTDEQGNILTEDVYEEIKDFKMLNTDQILKMSHGAIQFLINKVDSLTEQLEQEKNKNENILERLILLESKLN
jgi:hypothetical protein